MLASSFKGGRGAYKSCANVRNVDDACDVALHGSARQEEIDLVIVVAWKECKHVSRRYNKTTSRERTRKCNPRTISLQILNDPKTSLPIRHRSIEVMLLALLIHTESLKVNIPSRAKLRLDRAGDVNRTLHAQLLHAALHDREFDGDDAGHLDGAAERDLPVALREVQVAHAELGPLDVHRQVHFAAA